MRVEETGNFFVVPAEGGGGEGGIYEEKTLQSLILNFPCVLHFFNLVINVQPWQCPVLHEIQSLPSVALPPELDSSKQ